MIRGERLYSDFFEFLPPGSFLIVAGWFRLVGSSFIAVRILATITIASIAFFTYLTCLKTSKHVVISAAAAIAWVFWSELVWNLQINHSWFTTLFSMISAWAALASMRSGFRLSSMPLISGLSAGAATMITPHKGALAALACLTAFVGPARSRSTFFKFTGSFAIIPVLLCLYLVARGSLAAAFADVIVFTATRYPSIQSVPYANGGTRSNPLKYIHLITAIMTVLLCVSSWRSASRDRTLWTTAALALAGVLGVYPRPDVVHIAFSLPLLLPLVAYCSAEFVRRSRPLLVYLASAFVLLFCLPNAKQFYEAARQSLNAKLTPTPRGQVALSDYGGAELVEQLNSGSGTYFFYPDLPMLSYLMAKKQVSKYDQFVPHYTTARQYRDACEDVVKGASFIVLDAKWNDQGFLSKAFPAMAIERDINKEEFEKALHTWFEPAWQYGQFQILHRVAKVPDNACSGVP